MLETKLKLVLLDDPEHVFARSATEQRQVQHGGAAGEGQGGVQETNAEFADAM